MANMPIKNIEVYIRKYAYSEYRAQVLLQCRGFKLWSVPPKGHMGKRGGRVAQRDCVQTLYAVWDLKVRFMLVF